jgi:hypothetical protein
MIINNSRSEEFTGYDSPYLQDLISKEKIGKNKKTGRLK